MQLQRTLYRLFATCAVMLTMSASNAAEPLSALAEQGRALYYGTQVFERAATVSGAALPASASACVQCHGPLGEGSRESNTAAPDIRLTASASQRISQSMAAALRDARGRDGRALGAGMPRYTPTADELAALEAFWPWLGSARQPQRGVSAGEVRLGVVLDALANPAARMQVVAGVQSVFDQANAAGGVHGRRLRLIGMNRAWSEEAFALVASAPLPSTQQALRKLRLPSIASLDFQLRDADPGGWQWPLLPSLQQQARMAVEQLESAPPNCMRRTFDPKHWSGAANSDTAPTVPTTEQPLCVAALAPATDVDALRTRWRADGIKVRQLIELSGMRPKLLTEPYLEHQLVLSVPLAVADQAEQQGQSLWFVLGQASARTLVEALARSGPSVVPESLLAQMRTLTGFAPLPGAPLAYSRSSAHGWRPEIYSPASPSSRSSDQRPRKELP